MSTNHHTPHSAGFGLDAANFNSIYSTLDQAITDLAADVATVSGSAQARHIVGGRLTLTSGTPVTTSDVTGANADTLYWTPFVHDVVGLFNPTSGNWELREFTESSIPLLLSANTVYDVFLYWNGANVLMETEAWLSATARSTSIVRQNGVWVKSGDASRRYVGTFRTTSVGGRTEDSKAKRLLWNAYNRVPRLLEVTDVTANWTYTTATWRQARGSGGNQVEMVIGLPETVLRVSSHCGATCTSGNPVIGVGIDKTNGNDASIAFAGSSGGFNQLAAWYEDFPGIGYHYAAWVEYGAGGASFFSGSLATSGLKGVILG